MEGRNTDGRFDIGAGRTCVGEQFDPENVPKLTLKLSNLYKRKSICGRHYILSKVE